MAALRNYSSASSSNACYDLIKCTLQLHPWRCIDFPLQVLLVKLRLQVLAFEDIRVFILLIVHETRLRGRNSSPNSLAHPMLRPHTVGRANFMSEGLWQKYITGVRAINKLDPSTGNIGINILELSENVTFVFNVF